MKIISESGQFDGLRENKYKCYINVEVANLSNEEIELYIEVIEKL